MIDTDQHEARATAENYRHQRQAAEARANGFDALTREEYLTWTETHDAELIEIARRGGLNSEEAREAVDEYKSRIRTAVPGAPFDDTNIQLIVQGVVHEIESICRLGLIPIRDGVVHGVSPQLGLRASQMQVLGTKASIISVTLPFIPFINLVSKTFALCLPLYDDPTASVVCNDPAKVAAYIREHPILMRYWIRMLRSYAVEGWLPPRPLPQVNGILQSVVRIQLLKAMELFAIAHEYGHHALRHGEFTSTDADHDGFQHEYEADTFARAASAAIGSRSEPPNLYAMSGVGAVLVLGSLDLVRRAQSVLLNGDSRAVPSTTHPALKDRIQNIALLDGNAPPDYQEAYRDLRDCFLTILDNVWSDIEPVFKRLHVRGLRPNPGSPEAGGWLP